jgi:hypothetical protein
MFRFTIRDVLWLTVAVALGVVWFCDYQASAWSQRVAEAKLRLAEGELKDLSWSVKTYPSGREFSVERIYRPEP